MFESRHSFRTARQDYTKIVVLIITGLVWWTAFSAGSGFAGLESDDEYDMMGYSLEIDDETGGPDFCYPRNAGGCGHQSSRDTLEKGMPKLKMPKITKKSMKKFKFEDINMFCLLARGGARRKTSR